MEIWLTIPFEDQYEVSDLGRVRNKQTKHIKSLRYNKGGYLRVTLYPSGKTYAVHSLVGKVFLQEFYREGLQIDHLNSVRDDNRLCNLEWVTAKENTRRINKRADVKGMKNPCSKITEQQAYYIKYTFDIPNSVMCRELGLSRSIVEKIRNRERWVHIIDPDLESKYINGEIKYKRLV
jgi:hypothetical protein